MPGNLSCPLVDVRVEMDGDESDSCRVEKKISEMGSVGSNHSKNGTENYQL